MTVLAIAYVNSISQNENGLLLEVQVRPVGDDRVATDSYGPVSVGSLSATWLPGLADWSKAKAEAEFGVSFGLLDTVHMIYPIDAML